MWLVGFYINYCLITLKNSFFIKKFIVAINASLTSIDKSFMAMFRGTENEGVHKYTKLDKLSIVM